MSIHSPLPDEFLLSRDALSERRWRWAACGATLMMVFVAVAWCILERVSHIQAHSSFSTSVLRYVDAWKQGDFDTVVALTHPEALEMHGGKQMFLTRVRELRFALWWWNLAMSPTTDRKADEWVVAAALLDRWSWQWESTSNNQMLIVGVSRDHGRSWKFIPYYPRWDIGAAFAKRFPDRRWD